MLTVLSLFPNSLISDSFIILRFIVLYVPQTILRYATAFALSKLPFTLKRPLIVKT
jgi:hypothetical protein